MRDFWAYERAAYAQGFSCVCGTDEAGRGPLAGPVCAAAVLLPRFLDIPGLDDSKRLTEKRREALFSVICEAAVSYGIAFVSAAEIDRINILNASQKAMRLACEKLACAPDLILVDGNIARDFPCAARPVVKGDSLSAQIAAASVLAKVSRDKLLCKTAEAYPQYGFARHKGYGTKEHIAALRAFGPCPEHRRSFLGFLEDAR